MNSVKYDFFYSNVAQWEIKQNYNRRNLGISSYWFFLEIEPKILTYKLNVSHFYKLQTMSTKVLDREKREKNL